MKKNKAKIFLSFLIAMGLFVSCEDNGNEQNTGIVKINLTDAPAEVEAVNVQVTSVEINYESDTTENGWVVLNSYAGIYNLLELQNGVDTLIAEEEVPEGTIGQVRLILGSDNTMVMNGDTINLKVPSAYNTGIKIPVGKTVNADNVLELTLDFDAESSVVSAGHATFLLKPVIKLKETAEQEETEEVAEETEETEEAEE